LANAGSGAQGRLASIAAAAINDIHERVAAFDSVDLEGEADHQ
jgi:hypothetical protein